eukprot:3627799-Pyramimonas_sp.AAC.1
MESRDSNNMDCEASQRVAAHPPGWCCKRMSARLWEYGWEPTPLRQLLKTTLALESNWLRMMMMMLMMMVLMMTMRRKTGMGTAWETSAHSTT